MTPQTAFQLEALRSEALLGHIETLKNLLAAVCATLPQQEIRALAQCLRSTHKLRAITTLPDGRVELFVDSPDGTSEKLFEAAAIAQPLSS